MRADLYTNGDYILHLDSDVVVLEDITYSHIFHRGKPVLPFRRYRNEIPEGEHGICMCVYHASSNSSGYLVDKDSDHIGSDRQSLAVSSPKKGRT